MGAGASAEGAATFDGMTKEEVADEVAGMGKAFEPYKEVALDNDIDGATLADLTDTDLEEIGVEKGLHRKKILAKIASPSKPDAATRCGGCPRADLWRRRSSRRAALPPHARTGLP